MFAIKSPRGRYWIVTEVHNYGNYKIYQITRPIDNEKARLRDLATGGNGWDRWRCYPSQVKIDEKVE